MKKLFSLFVLLMVAVGGYAQSDDFGVYSTLSVEKKIDKKASVGVEAEMRTRENLSTFDRWSIGVDGSYKLTKWLKASAGYTLLYDNNEKTTYKKYEKYKGDPILPNKYVKYWGIRHRFNVSLTGNVDLGDFNVSLRERWQYTYRPSKTVPERYDYKYQRSETVAGGYEIESYEMDGEEKTYNGKGKNVLRSRLQVEYSKKSFPLKPFASVELHNSWPVEKVRFIVGADWKVTKQSTIGLNYRYDRLYDDSDDRKPNIHVLHATYKYKF